VTPNAEIYALVLQAWAWNQDHETDHAAGVGGGGGGGMGVGMLQHWTQVGQWDAWTAAAEAPQSSVSLPMPNYIMCQNA